MKRISMLAASLLVLSACGGEEGPANYLEIAGGGLVFNYRYSQATMVVVAKQMSPLPEGSLVEAAFQLPGGTAREKVQRPALAGKLTYKLESGYLKGIRKGEALLVTVVLRDKDGRELDRDETSFTSDLDQAELPSAPLVVPDKPNYVPQLENL